MMKVEEGSVGGDSVTDERKEGDPCLEPVARASFTHVYLLALAMKLGGCTIAWNYGFAAGFWEYFLAVVGLGTAYVLFGLCMAEMVSIMTFSGGYYGYARVILGPLGGYLVGCSGLLESIFYFGMNILKISEFVWICFDLNPALAPFIWFITYIILLFSVIVCSFNFWEITSFYTISMLIILMIYLFGSMPHLNFAKYALLDHSGGFRHDPGVFLEQFRLCILFFIGFDLLTLTASEVSDVSPIRSEMNSLLTKLSCRLKEQSPKH